MSPTPRRLGVLSGAQAAAAAPDIALWLGVRDLDTLLGADEVDKFGVWPGVCTLLGVRLRVCLLDEVRRDGGVDGMVDVDDDMGKSVVEISGDPIGVAYELDSAAEVEGDEGGRRSASGGDSGSGASSGAVMCVNEVYRGATGVRICGLV